MVKLTKERERIILEYIRANQTKSNSEIARILKKSNPKGLEQVTTDSLRSVVAKVRKDNDLYQVKVVDVKDDTKWKVVNNHYHWKSKGNKVELPVELIDELFYEYSEYGLNLSQTEIINKHNLPVQVWHSIKNTLQLYKKSHVFSPYTVQITPVDQLEGLVKEKVSKVFTSVGYQVEQQYNKQLRQEYKKVIKKQTEKELFIQTILVEVQDMFDEIKPEIKPIIRVNKKANSLNEKPLCVFIFDVHFGAESRSELLPPFDPEILKEQFEQIAEEINAYNSNEVHIFFGGDNIETFTGLNHPDSWKGIAKGYYGAELMKRAYKAYVEFISQVTNVKCIYAVPGNHDRATESKAVDGEGWMAAILFEFIRLSFGDKIPVKYDDRIVSERIDDINYMISHGHLKLTDISAAELILQYGDPACFNVLVSGHWHNRKIKKDHRQFRQIVSPSIFVGNNYSEGLGVSSLPGYLIIQARDGKPLITDCPL